MSLLRVEGVVRRFGAIRAVDGVSIVVDKGEIRGVVGPNGAGKTSLFNVITGFLSPSEGRLFLDGAAITRWPIHRRVRAGMARTFQTPQLFRESSVLENVLSGGYANELRPHLSRQGQLTSRERAQNALEIVSLDHVASANAGDLPYPAQKRLEIARALMTEPRILLLDEPAAGMNESEAVELAQLIKIIRAQGLTIVVIEHNMRLIMDVSDRVTVINFGKVIADGTPREVRENPAVVSAYLGASA
jgi:branched-chain amino acid transport system ATP-binding protein